MANIKVDSKQVTMSKPRYVFLMEWRPLMVRAVVVHYNEEEAAKLIHDTKPTYVDTLGVSLNEPGIILMTDQ